MTDATFERLKNALADRYTIERELGAGGMATVYLAEDINHHRRVAVKVLSPELAAALGTERFLQEIETAARLHHPHVLPLYDSGEADGLLYFVMREEIEDVGEVVLGEAVEVRDDRIQFVNHVLLLIFFERSALNADILGPVSEAVIWAGETTG